MYLAALLISLMYGICFALSRKEEAPKGKPAPFYRMAIYLYKFSYIKRIPLFRSKQVEADIKRLYPGESGQRAQTDYYVKKISLSLIILFAGTALGVLVSIREEGRLILDKEGIVVREEDEQTVEIAALTKGQEEANVFTIRIAPKILSGERLEEVLREFENSLPELILAENTSLEHVNENLKLLEEHEGFPFTVEWTSDRPDVVDGTGKVYVPAETTEVALTAVLFYGESQWKKEITVCVTPKILSYREQVRFELEELLTLSEKESRMEETWRLPKTWRGEEVEWRQVTSDKGFLLWVMTLVASGAVYLLNDRDLHEKTEKRKKLMKKEYSEIVHRLLLYLGAGMTIRGAFQKASSQPFKSRGKIPSPAYEEMRYTCRELQAGVSENAAYERFGKRSGMQEYIRLSTLLVQNLKKGNSALLDRLKEEADKACEDQLQNARRLGEEAGTKLLLPMVMLLLVVMIMVMLPAFYTMGT